MIITFPCGGIIDLEKVSKDKNIPIHCSVGCVHTDQEIALRGAEILQRQAKSVYGMGSGFFLVLLSCAGIRWELPNILTVEALNRLWTFWELCGIVGCFIVLGFLIYERF